MTGKSSPQGRSGDADTPTAVVGATKPSSVAASSSSSSWGVGSPVGRYVVVETLGSGGMGTVLRAYDPKLRREVALKRVRSDVIDARSRARLVREAQAMAQLSHPNVVAVYDVDSDGDDVVIAMEYVPGQTLRSWLKEGERPWAEVVEVFHQAGLGLAAAHRAGLVHRDFKPANVLLESAEGEALRVKVTDFGLAKSDQDPNASGVQSGSVVSSPDSLDVDLESPLTEADVVVGTPVFMAPEQYGGSATPASDQYAFCIAMWRAVVGRPPFEARGRELVKAKHDGPPAWPRGVDAPARIGVVLRRGLAPRPESRYPSMAELLDALLDDPDARRRRRVVLTLGALGTIGMLGALVRFAVGSERCGGGAEQIAAVYDEARAAQAEAAVLATNLGYAADTWERVAPELAGYAQGWADEHREACEATARGEQSDTVLDARMACLARARDELDATLELFTKADAQIVERAVSLVDGLPSLERCADPDTLAVSTPIPQDAELATEVERLRGSLARVGRLLDAGRVSEAEAMCQQLEPEVAAVDYPPLSAELALNVSFVHQDSGRYEESEARGRQALSIALSSGMNMFAAQAAKHLAIVVGAAQGHPEQGAWLAEFAVGLAEAEAPNTILEAGAHGDLAVIHRELGRLEDAERETRRAIELYESIGADLDAAGTRSNLAVVLHIQGRKDEALREIQEAVRMTALELGPDHPRVADMRSNLANALATQGEFDEAETQVRQAIATLTRAVGPDHPNIAGNRFTLGNIHIYRGELKEAEAEYRAALALWTESLGPEHRDVALARGNLGTVLARQGRLKEAEPELRAALKIWKDTLPAEHPQLASAHRGLGQLLVDLDRPTEAEPHMRRALEIREAALPPGHPDTAQSSVDLALLLLETDPARARQLLEGAWSTLEEADVPSSDRARCAWALGRSLAETDPPDMERAEELARRALRLLEDESDPRVGLVAERNPLRGEIEQWLDAAAPEPRE